MTLAEFPRTHNLPDGLAPITADLLDEDLADWQHAADKLVKAAEGALINTDRDASNVHLLGAQIKTLAKNIDEQRKAKSEPYRQAVNLINDRYHRVADPLTAAVPILEGMLGEWQTRKAADAEEARRHAEEEARKRQQVADAAAAKANEGAQSTLAAIKAQEEADLAVRRAETIRPMPIATQVGSVAGKRERRHQIDDINKAIRWLAKVNKAALVDAVERLVASQLHRIPIDKYEASEIPGVRVWIETKAQIRSR